MLRRFGTPECLERPKHAYVFPDAAQPLFASLSSQITSCENSRGCAPGGFSLDARDIYAGHLFVLLHPSSLFIMTFQATPTEAGVYRVKVYGSGNDLYWRYMTDASPSWIKRTDLDASSDDFKVSRNMTSPHHAIALTPLY